MTTVVVQGGGTVEVTDLTSSAVPNIVVEQGAGLVEVTTPATQVVTVQAVGPVGPPGPLGPFLGHVWIDGAPRAGEVVFRCLPGETLVVGANLANWVVLAQDAATAHTTAEVLRDATTVGTLTWAPGGTTPILATTGAAAQTFGPAEALSVVFPTPADATLGRISLRVYATRP